MIRRRSWQAAATVTACAFLYQTSASAHPADVGVTSSLVPSPLDAASPGSAGPVDPSGAAAIAIPIPVAPNRNRMAPQLALAYSSRNPLRGGVAMGWSLAIPRIELDTSRGRMGAPRYRSSLAGNLIRVDEPIEAGWEAYRGSDDASFTRYERQAGMPAALWRARTLDGTVHYFGESPASKDTAHPGAAADALEGRWFITRTVDHFGNEIRYQYTQVMGTPPGGGAAVPVDIALGAIDYGGNPGAGLSAHSRIVFDYAATPDLCPGSALPIGARFDYRTGFPIYEGARRLTRVHLDTLNGGQLIERRRLDLTYDPSELACSAGRTHAPLRILTAVQETGFAEDGTPTVLPPQTFTYNRLDRMFDVTTPIGDGAGLLGHGVAGAARTVYPEAGMSRPIVQSMLLDVDGDGRVDRIDLDAAGDPARCTSTWRRNQGGFMFAPPAPFGTATGPSLALPAVPWANGATRDDGLGERCSLSHQVSAVTNRPDFESAYPQVCDAIPAPPALPRAVALTVDSFRYLDWDRDGVLDLVSVVESRPDRYRPEYDPRVSSTLVCDESGENACTRREEESCGRHVVRVYRGLRTGGYAAPTTVRVPATFNPEDDREHTIADLMFDIDGDGRLDGVTHSGSTYQVRRDRGDGTFADPAVSFGLPLAKGYEHVQGQINYPDDIVFGWLSFAPSITYADYQTDDYIVQPTPPGQDPVVIEFITSTLSYAGNHLADVNGDGLADLVSNRGTGLRVFYNQGTRFEAYADHAEGDRGSLVSGVLGALDSDLDKLFYGWDTEEHLGPYTRHGDFQGAATRAVDFDGDGLQDVVEYTAPDSVIDIHNPTSLHLNVGDRLIFEGTLPLVEQVADAIAHRRETPRATSGTWQYESAFIDLDGDGLPEAIDTESGGLVVARSDSDLQPMRLLKSTDNGRGGRSDFHYHAVTGQGVPSPLWVVDAVTTSTGGGAGTLDPSVTTSFEYQQPMYLPDLEGNYGFRGFATTTEHAATGARTVTMRSYDQSFAGLPTETRVYGDGDHLVSRTTTTYEERHLFEADAFPGMVRTFHPSVVTTRTCTANQAELACAGGGLRTSSETYYVALGAAGGPPVMQAVQYQREGAIPGQDGSRGTWFFSQLVDDGAHYLRVPVVDTGFWYGPTGIPTVDVQTTHYYDASNRFEYYTSRWVGGSQWAVTSRGFDVATGNQTLLITPRYFGTGPGMTFEYDAQRRFVTATVDQLGHRVTSTYDAATGAPTSQRGPNQRPCGASCTIADGTLTTYDGLGRPLTRSVFVDDAALGYRPELVSRDSYLDSPSPRTKVVHEQSIDFGGTRFAKTEIEYDGAGRPVIERSFESTALRSELRRHYDGRGLLTSVLAPRPGAAQLSWVEWQYEYDALGRMIAMREPSRPGCTGPISSATPDTFCGKRWIYDGRTRTVEDVVGTAGGRVARTRETIDALDRMVRSEQQLDSGAWAVTAYGFDSSDHIVRTESADGVVTTMTQDAIGRRTSVQRDGNLWQLGYDLDGNLESVTSPVPAGAIADDYVTHIEYDALGRETRRMPAKRAWGAAEQARFGTGEVLHTYDLGDNGVGRLTTVSTDWGAIPRHTVDYAYDARGLIREEHQAISVPGTAIGGVRTLRRTYNAQGAIDSATEGDGTTATGGTTLVTYHDDRGLTIATEWQGHGWVQSLQRATDGRVVARSASVDGLAVAQSTTAVDEVGRVVGLTVSSTLPGDGAMSQRAAEIARYDGGGDLDKLDTWLSATSSPGSGATASYGYDAMHRLTAASGDQDYLAAFAYSPGGRITSAAVSAGPGAAHVVARDVTYTYAAPGSGADPDAPVALANHGSAGDFMTIAYDRAGNAIARQTEDGGFAHVYDGLDRQREVQHPDGSIDRAYYEADGMRAVTVAIAPGGAVAHVTWRLGNTELTYDGAGQLVKRVAWSGGDGGAVRIVNQARPEWTFQDGRADTIAVVGHDGDLLAGFTYGPYGELLRAEGSEVDDHRERFNSKPIDPDSGVSYYGLRYYDERSLSWTQADPVFRFLAAQPQNGTLYSFDGGKPTTRVDGLGLAPGHCGGYVSCMTGTAPEDFATEMFKLMAKDLALQAVDYCAHSGGSGPQSWCGVPGFADRMRKELNRKVVVIRSTAQLRAILADANFYTQVTSDGTFFSPDAKRTNPYFTGFTNKNDPSTIYMAPAVADDP